MKTVTNKKNKKSQTKYKTIPKNTNTEKNIKNIRKKSKNKTNILTINRESNKHETYLQKNIKYLKNIKNINGFLIGGASQKQNKFIDIIKKTIN